MLCYCVVCQILILRVCVCVCVGQMYVEEVESSLGERELACIVQTALGVADLSVASLFRAVDAHGKGKITFGEEHDSLLVNEKMCR